MLKRQDFLVEAVGLHDRVVHLGLGDLAPEPFDHDDCLSVEATIRSRSLSFISVGGGQGDVLVGDPAEPDGADGPHEGDRARGSGRRRRR